jgi:hypothetical protein
MSWDGRPADWRNNGACESGPLHWPVAVNHARKLLRTALREQERSPGQETQVEEERR